MLASAYELQENKFNAVNFYKQALIINPECYEAFERLIKNNLLVEDEKCQLINQLKFISQTLWLKDFYLAKVNKSISSNETEGIV